MRKLGSTIGRTLGGVAKAGVTKASLVFLLSVATVGTLASAAVFTDSQALGANAFTTGSIDISSSPTTELVTFSGMLPGDTVTAPVTVSNDGTVQMRYAVTSTTDEDTLAGQLDLTVKSGVTTCTNGGFGTDGSSVYATGDLGSVAGIDIIGDPTQGSDTGDRTLAAAASETLCFQVALPLSTTSTYAGLSTTASLNFQAEQTANNS